MAVWEKVSDAPDAVKRLRRFVLDLAVRGKLTTLAYADERQVSFDRPAAQGMPKKARSLANGPYSLPSSWVWSTIGQQLDLINGMAFKPSDWRQEGLRIIRIQNLNRPDANFNFADPSAVRDRFKVDTGALLLSWSGTPGTSFGAFTWMRGPAVLNQHIFRCDFLTDDYEQAFLQLAINGRLDEMIARAHGGVGLQHITKGKLEAMLIPLPPRWEQLQVTAKYKELMALCDVLQAARAEREARRDRLAAASLARLNTPDPETFPADTRFALDTLPAITAHAEHIASAR